eukprot:407828-Heterocapsa_arctica.AAC.1
MDARPGNVCECALKYWTCLMAASSAVCHIQLPADCALSCWADGLTDYYYQFKTSVARSHRNCLKGV